MSSKLSLRAFIVLMVVLFLGALPAMAEDACKEKDKNGTFAAHACNGISVGAPKVFDNRTLTLMLEALSQTLSAQQQSYIDQKSVLAALSNIQGFSQTETSTNLSVTGTPTPATDVKTTFDTGKVDANGKPLPSTFQRQTDVNRPNFTPQAPTLDTLPAFQGFNPTYGSSASDLLNDQVNLTYQIFNLRMILERSLTDRLLPGANGPNKTRLQAVLGFNVTIDPPRTANDAVAVVEVTLTAEDNGDMSLVSLMPQEKTYNAAALSTKSNAFAGSAAVSAFQVGFSARKRGQIFYLYRDSDTVAYERMTGTPNKIVFGWMFRPVLGRRSVSPGLRQLFAIMALPNVNCLKVEDNGTEAGNSCKARLTSEVRTYWKKYDRGTLTSFEHGDANRASQFWYRLSLGLTKPQIFDDRKYENEADYKDLEVHSSAEYQKELKPTVSNVTWRPTGAKSIVISARGNNFFSQTAVALGDKTYSEGAGLTLKSNQAFDLITTLDALANGPGTVLGRYDIGVPLTNLNIPDSLKNGVEVQSAFLRPALAGIRKIEIHLQKKASEQQLSELAQSKDAERSALRQLSAATELKAAEDQKQKAKTTAEHSAAKNRLDAAHRDFVATKATTSDIAVLQTQAKITHSEVQAEYRQIHSLQAQDLPFETTTTNLRAPETPVVSVNGSTLDLPYEISNTTEGGLQHVVIQANVKDSVVSESGGGIVKVSWPFYPQDRWTATYRFYNPDLAFQVTRVSQKSILISRVDGFSFVNGPENNGSLPCWRLIAGDEKLPLTAGCPAEPKACEKKPDICALSLPASDYTVTATVDNLPDKVVLVAPIGSIYTLSIPTLKAKDDKTGPIELKQYDAQWIEIKAADLATSSTATTGAAAATSAKNAGPDLSTVTVVEANGITLNTAPVKQGDKSIKVEITRDLTSKFGTVDIAFRNAAKEILGTRQLHITQTEWGSKGDK